MDDRLNVVLVVRSPKFDGGNDYVNLRKVGICESSMRNKIVGRRDFKFSEFRKVLQAFPGLSWEYLFEREEDTACEEISKQESAS